MEQTKIGPIEIVMGKNNSKVPFSTSLLIHNRDETALIDCWPGRKILDSIKKEKQPKHIFLTHYHLDHVLGINEFPEAKVWINPYDKKKLSDLQELTVANGIYAAYGKKGSSKWIDKHIEFGRKHNRPSLHEVAKVETAVYPYDEPLQVAGEKMIMIHSPGHSEGMALPYFPDYGVLCVVDYDLSSFGPWYMNADSDIDQFIESGLKTLGIDAEYFITSHHKGMVQRKEYEQMLRDYLQIIDNREKKLIAAIEKGVSPKDIIYEEVFYFKSTHEKDPSNIVWEKLGIAKHLQRLAKNSGNMEEYYNDYIDAHHMSKDYLSYRGIPYPADNSLIMTKAHCQ